MGHHNPHDRGEFRGEFRADFKGPKEFGGRAAGRRNRGGFGGPPPWLAELFGPGGGRGFGAGMGGAGFGGPGPRGRHGGRGPRVRRGDVRAAILDVLAENAGADNGQPLNGYAVIQRIAERTEGVWKPSPGSVYPTVQQLEDEGLVVTEESGGRKVLRLTEAGAAYVAEHPDEMAAVWAPFEGSEEDETGSTGADLKKVIGQTMGAVWQLASTGTTAQVEEAIEVLADTRRRLYTILAEGDAEQ